MKDQKRRDTAGRSTNHAIRAMREPFGKAGFAVAIAALVLATTGAAFAASALSGKQKKEVVKIAKRYAGKSGPQGASGPTGPAGAAGGKGDAGAKGDPGASGPIGPQGDPGLQGAPGQSAPCTKGEPVCTLPSGVTETGTWAITATAAVGSLEPTAAISFPIPLAAPGGVESALAFNESETANGETGVCAGTVEEPTAPAGTLCIYTFSEVSENAEASSYEVRSFAEFGTGHYSVSGATLFGPRLNASTEAAFLEARGSWAVTAP